MPKIVWVKVSNPRIQYVTTILNDPNVPAGYALSNTSDGSWQGVDGLTDQNLQRYKGGLWSGGFPPYDGPSGYKTTANANNANGHLGGN